MKKSLLLLLLFLPVFARGQTFTGTITSTQCFSVNVYGQGTVGINVSGGSWSGTIQPKVIADTDANAAASNVQVTPYSSSTAQSTITANGDYSASVAGATWFQLCGNTVTNTATVKVTPVRLSANRNAGTGNGNVITSGSPTVGQPARWVDGTHVTGGLFSLDATAFPGTGTGDAADKIKQCLATALGIVPCDATGFSGTQVVTLGSTGMLDPTQRGSVKFGRVTFQSTTLPMLVIGSKTVVEGFDSDGSIGTNVGDSGTDFQYTGTDPGANAAIICFGDSLGCGNSAGGGGNFHSPVSKLGADCKGTAHCVPFNNSVAQENSPVNLLSVKNFTGPGIQISNLDGTACSNCQNFFMSNVMSYEKGDFCTATTDALYVNASTFGIMIQKGTFVYNAGVGSSQSCKTTSPGEVARITSLGFNCIDCHFEANGASFLAATNGVVLGLDGNTANTVLTDASFASFGGSATLMTISSAFAQTNNSGFINAHGGSSGALNLLNDQVVTGNMPVALSSEANIGSYVIGKNGTGLRQSSLNAAPTIDNRITAGTVGQPAVYTGTRAIGTSGGWINVKALGAKGDTQTVTDASITSGSGALTTASSGKFVAGDVGKTIQVLGAGAAGVTLVTTIATFVNANSVTLTATAGTTVTTTGKAFWGTNDTTVLQNAINGATAGQVVYFPTGNYTETGLTAVSGVSFQGDPPQVTAPANQNPDLNMIASGGTWLNCTTTNCISGTALREVNIRDMGFENFTGQGLLFGGNNVDGISFANWSNLTFIGSTVTNGSDQAAQIFNFQHLSIEGFRVFNTNVCMNLINQSQFIQGGNSEVYGFYCSTYTKSAANANNTEPGLWLQVLTPASGTAAIMDYVSFFRPQINSYNGDGTGINVSVVGLSGHQMAGIGFYDSDIEGTFASGFNIDQTISSYFGLLKDQNSSSNTVFNLTTNTARNTIVSADSSATVADANATSACTNAYFGQFNAATSCMSGTFLVSSGSTLNFNSGFTVTNTTGNIGALTARSITATGATSQLSNLQLGAADINVSRSGAGVLAVGTGAGASTNGRVKASGYISVGTKFTSNSGCTESATAGGATAGKFTVGQATACTIIITMGDTATAPNGWTCIAYDQTAVPAVAIRQTASTATTCSLLMTVATNDVVTFSAIGY